MSVVVSDSSPLIVFHQIDRLDLLREMFREVLIPPAVAGEIAPSISMPPEWMHIVNTKPSHESPIWSSSLDRGEIEAIALALELSATQILLDDRPARRIAQQLGLFVAGSLALLLEALRSGAIHDVQPMMDAMIGVGFHVGTPLYAEVLALAREINEGTH